MAVLQPTSSYLEIRQAPLWLLSGCGLLNKRLPPLNRQVLLEQPR